MSQSVNIPMQSRALQGPAMWPHLPATPDQIASASLLAAEDGAAIFHLHARDPETGRPTPSTEVFRRGHTKGVFGR